MCGELRADFASHFVNAQLKAHWENALSCLELHGEGRKPSNPIHETGMCLAEYYHGVHQKKNSTVRDMNFFASFAAPKIQFVCNHYAILKFELKKGHLNPDSRAANPVQAKHHDFQNLTVSFRIEFKRSVVPHITSEVIGKMKYDLHLMVLDISTAKLISEVSQLTGIVDANNVRTPLFVALEYYMTRYLELYKSAGYHVFYGLPDFDIHKQRSDVVDFIKLGITSSTFYGAPKMIQGVSLDSINYHMKRMWHEAADHIDQWDDNDGDIWDHSDKFAFAEHRTQWLETGPDLHNFHVRFAPPELKLLCEKEAILIFNIDEVDFYRQSFEEEASHTFKGWKLAIVVDFVFTELEEGLVTKGMIDFRSQRFCSELSSFTGVLEDVKLFEVYKKIFIQYITKYYLGLIGEAGHGTVYHHDVRVKQIEHHTGGIVEDILHGGDDYENFIICDCESEAVCTHSGSFGFINWLELFRTRYVESSCYDYDIVTAVTQGSINAHLLELYSLAKKAATGVEKTWITKELISATCLYEWAHYSKLLNNTLFNTTFLAPRVQFVMNEKNGLLKVILYIQLSSGSVRLLQGKKCPQKLGEEHTFTAPRLAFEVELRIVDHNPAYGPKSIFDRREAKDYDLKHLIMDLSTARFSSKHSYIGSYGTQHSMHVRDSQAAVLHYIKEHYFPAFMDAGHHVLYSIPMRHPQHDGLSLSPRFLNVHMYPFFFGSDKVIEGAHSENRLIGDRNMIVFAGVLGTRTTYPTTDLPKSINWICDMGQERSDGVVCLSRSTFLDGHLLKILTAINAKMTLVPDNLEFEDGKWHVELKTWAEHEHKKKKTCKWTSIKVGASSLDYEWQNKDKWSYVHEGTLGYNGTYAISCNTANTVHIPTGKTSGSKGGLNITMKGRVTLSLSFSGKEKAASTSASARWELVIGLRSDPARGVAITAVDQVEAVIEGVESSNLESFDETSEVFEDASSRLKRSLPMKFETKKIRDDITSMFQGGLPLMYRGRGARKLAAMEPAFTRTGDLLLELKPTQDEVKPVIKPPAPSRTMSSASNVQSPGSARKGIFATVAATITEGVAFVDDKIHGHSEHSVVNGSANVKIANGVAKPVEPAPAPVAAKTATPVPVAAPNPAAAAVPAKQPPVAAAKPEPTKPNYKA